mmetsp:Transcript_9381/g.10113  ORF Transcript_9381/g.10113 Transcript_9381/m.10113 type:complete len:191 (-) Transcript_9381:83-655(-)|eukprot:CAMPEP_0173154236 /NCGR_PEP_ID=MMETSP1105-20130129/13358_1 /TAXON_ID=2985 /ORGANISM="Ochromonas sp., Strain BG-1" /LENGTH=190 /DNA_ID=CAMNT_0014070369 /DNA_START=40 /DNA_END=612 /DNA_ORIENTATION=-
MDALADVSSLSTLLNQSREANELRAEQFQQKPSSTAPTNVKVNRGQSQTNGDSTVAVETARNPSARESKSIWDDAEIPSEDALLVHDERPAPRYEFSYKQSIGTEDTFLGLGDKTPLTSDCTHLVIKIHFPKSSMKELDLDVSKTRIIASSKTHRLFTYFPVNVDDQNGKAQFDSKKEVLTVTLPIIPDF